MKHLIALLTLTLSSAAFATDAYSYRNLGFSADGRYYAFVQSVQQDGSGYPDAQGFVIEVAPNKMVAAKRVLIEKETATVSQAVQQVIAKMNLPKYGITGKNLGRTLWVRLETDLTDGQDNPSFSTNYWVDGGASTVTPKFRLEVIDRPVPVGEECFYEDTKLLTVNLIETDGETVIKQTQLQNDIQAPKSRSCVMNYTARQVIQYKGSIVAIIRYLTPGFEGPDYMHMAVTGANALHQ